MWSPTDVGHKVTFEVDDVASPIANKKLALESLSSSPKVFFIHNLVSDKEAADLIKHAEKRITASTVGSIDPQLDAGRTSSNTWDSIIPASKDIIQRVYSLLRIPYAEVTVDGLQIVQYSPGKFYNSHLDFLESDNATPENNMLPHLGGTNRYATVFFYLNDVPEGGQTAFTKGEHLSDEDLVRTLHRPARPSLTLLFLDSSLCRIVHTTNTVCLHYQAKVSPELVPLLSTHKTEMDLTRMEEVLGRTNGLEKTMLGLCHSKLSVRPQKLSALLFYNTHPDLVVDEMALHGGCPVLDGAMLFLCPLTQKSTHAHDASQTTIARISPSICHCFRILKLQCSCDIGIKWGANLWVWNGDKNGMAGQTHNNIELNFYNMFDESVDIYWDNHGEHTYLTTLESGMGSQHETFHHHAFVMMVVRVARYHLISRCTHVFFDPLCTILTLRLCGI
jgi:prolyl 4-hydroxylase